MLPTSVSSGGVRSSGSFSISGESHIRATMQRFSSFLDGLVLWLFPFITAVFNARSCTRNRRQKKDPIEPLTGMVHRLSVIDDPGLENSVPLSTTLGVFEKGERFAVPVFVLGGGFVVTWSNYWRTSHNLNQAQ
jgi:hypothetical protein